MIKKVYVSVLVFMCFSVQVFSQNETKALFLGNSYTYYNQMPQMVSDIAESMGEELVTASNTPGGYTFEGHTTNLTSLALIEEGNWDFVILQEQSQIPSFPVAQVANESLPYAEALNDLIETYNPCSETVFYMTWGRENGDAGNCEFWPPICTYEGMDDLLAASYLTMADDNEAIVSPVGRVWRWIRENYPDLNLYASDGSHPSAEGSYAAAVSFYTVMFRDNPEEITFNSTISDSDADIIKLAVKTVVFDQFSEWSVGGYDLTADFDLFIAEETGDVELINTSYGAESYLWEINGNEYSSEDVFLMTDGQEFFVSLTTINECDTAYVEGQSVDFIDNISEKSPEDLLFYPNPVKTNVIFSKDVNRIIISDVKGKVCMDEVLTSRTVNVQRLNPGFYVMTCYTKEGEFEFHLIKE
jgi:hypothetical protein